MYILKIPFTHTPFAKELGALWSPLKKCWYAQSKEDFSRLKRWDPSRTATPNTMTRTTPYATAVLPRLAAKPDARFSEPMKADQFRPLILNFIGDNGSIKPADYVRLETMTNLTAQQIMGRLSDMLKKKMIKVGHIRDPRVQSLIALHIDQAQEECGTSFLSPLKDYLKSFIDEEIDYLQLRIAVIEKNERMNSPKVLKPNGLIADPIAQRTAVRPFVPLVAALLRKDSPPKLAPKEDPPIQSQISIARDIEKHLQKLIGNGQVRNRKNVIDELLKFGHISREGSDFLCVRAEGDDDSIRLQGVIFSRDFDLDRLDN